MPVTIELHDYVAMRAADRISAGRKRWYWASMAAEANAHGITAEDHTGPWTGDSLRQWVRRHAPWLLRPHREPRCPPTRPCPWVRCRYHLGLHVDAKGRIRAQPGVRDGDLEALPYGGCALDAALAGPHSQETTARLLGTWKAEVVALERSAIAKLRAAMAPAD